MLGLADLRVPPQAEAKRTRGAQSSGKKSVRWPDEDESGPAVIGAAAQGQEGEAGALIEAFNDAASPGGSGVNTPGGAGATATRGRGTTADRSSGGRAPKSPREVELEKAVGTLKTDVLSISETLLYEREETASRLEECLEVCPDFEQWCCSGYTFFFNT